MSYIENNLISGEHISFRTKIHGIAMTVPVLAAAFLALNGMIVVFASILGGVLLLLSGVFVLWLAFLVRSSIEMAVTNKRVIVKCGIIASKAFEMRLDKIESISVTQGILGRIFGYGTILVRGSGGSAEPFKTISMPMEFKNAVHCQIESASRSVPVAASIS